MTRRRQTFGELLDQTYSMERVSALSDGIFAIVLTLLVLELKIPELDTDAEAELTRDLVEQAPNVVAWVISFVLTARFWLVHHSLLQHLAQCKTGTLVVNFGVLALISLIPFGSGLIGTYEFDFVAIALFSGLLALCGLSVGLFARHVAINRHLHRTDSRADPLWHWRYHSLGIPLFAALAILLAWVHHPGVALATWIIEPLIALGLTLRRADTHDRHDPPETSA